jgi:hypothetical protein
MIATQIPLRDTGYGSPPLGNDSGWVPQGVPEDCLRLVSRNPKNTMFSQPASTRRDNTVVLNIGNLDESDYKENAIIAVFRTMKMVFERREIDLCDDDAYALFCLADLGERLSVPKK